MFRRSRTKHIFMCIKNIKILNACDLDKVRSQTEILHINSLGNVHVIEMSLNEKIRKNKIGMLHNSHNQIYMTSFMWRMNLSPHVMGDLCVAVYEMLNSFEKTNVPTCLIGNLKISFELIVYPDCKHDVC